jgi:hypothetical protein
MTDSIRWFRMYSEAVDDEKLRLLAFEDRWHFFALLCCKAQGLLNGGDDLMRRKVAVKMGLAVRELDEVSRRLAEVGLLDAETLQPLAWDRRQFKADDSKERVRAYRERMKRDVTVTVTAQETETETETDTEKEEKIERARSPRGARLPSDFPTPAEIDWCKQERPDLSASAMRDKFRDYWLGVPGAKGRKLDWPATWRNFVRGEFGRARDAPTRQDRISATVAALTGRTHQPEVIDVTDTRRLG